MKRALAVLLAFVGFSAFGIGTFSGKWEANITLLSSTGLTKNVLTINYSDFGWTFGAVLSLLGETTDTLKLTATGAFGPFTVDGYMNFNFTPAYLDSKLTTKLDFAGMSFSFEVYHQGPDHPDPYIAECEPQTNTEGQLKYTLTTTVAPFSAKLVFVDCCTGTEFYQAVIGLSDIGLCCGISLDAELSFTKAGFDYLSFSGIEIPLCCGVSLTADVKFTTTGKAVTTGFKFAGFADACFTVYGDTIGEPPAWQGIEIYGWKIKCTLGDCSYVEFLTALNPKAKVFEGIFQQNEFEYVKLGFCGAGCCGGQYTVDLAVYFQASGSLFGITRIGANMSIPVMSNLSVNVSFSTPDSLSVGWVFTF